MNLLNITESVKEQLDSGKLLEEVETDLLLSVLKPLHAQWLVNLYNYFTSPDGVKVISCGWKKAEITGLLDSTTILPPEDPFYSLPYKTIYWRGINIGDWRIF